MKLLLDQGLPRSAAELLRKVGMGTVHTGEIGYSAADDADILEYAHADERIVATSRDRRPWGFPSGRSDGFSTPAAGSKK